MMRKTLRSRTISKGDSLVVPDALSHRSEYALQQRARKLGLNTGSGKAPRTEAPAAPNIDTLDLAYEPRQFMLYMERAAAQGGPGGRQAKIILNQVIGASPSKRDRVIQYYIERLQKAGWKAGMKRGGA